jgi:hypothetical protein
LNTYDFAADDSMRLSVSEARSDGLVTNRALVAARSARVQVDFIFIVLFLSVFVALIDVLVLLVREE